MKSVLADLLPTCAVCNHPVQSLETTQDFRTCETVFVVTCHGQSEIVKIPKDEFLDGLKLEPGYAFTTKKIEVCSNNNKLLNAINDAGCRLLPPTFSTEIVDN